MNSRPLSLQARRLQGKSGNSSGGIWVTGTPSAKIKPRISPLVEEKNPWEGFRWNIASFRWKLVGNRIPLWAIDVTGNIFRCKNALPMDFGRYLTLPEKIQWVPGTLRGCFFGENVGAPWKDRYIIKKFAIQISISRKISWDGFTFHILRQKNKGRKNP